jgi:hypothetical protein
VAGQAAANGFVTEPNAGGTAAVYSTTLAGNGTISIGGIALDGAGDAYVTGSTTSPDFPTTPGACQTGYAGGTGTHNSADAYVTELNPTGSKLAYSTYLGGANTDGGAAIAVDASENAYLTGWTLSKDFPTLAPVQPALSPGNDFEGYQNADAFVATLNSTGSALAFSTFLGGTGDDYGFGIAVDPSGTAYVAGYTGSTYFPVTSGAYQSSPGNGFVAKITNPYVVTDYLSVTGFSPATAGTPGTITVTARDPSGNVLTGYAGTVHFSSSDGTATLPANYTFTASDAGLHIFPSVVLRK